MRFIGVIENERLGKQFSAFLNAQGIAHQCEVVISTDWGSVTYGTPICKIWVLEEDDVDKAAQYYHDFMQNPENPAFEIDTSVPIPKVASQDVQQEPKEGFKRFGITPPSVPRLRQPFGPVTLYLLIICSWIFMWGKLTAPSVESYPSVLPPTAILSPPINKKLFYDYPEAFVMIDKLIRFYGLEKLRTPEELPPEGQYLFLQYFRTPYWEGIYHDLLVHWQHPEEAWTFKAPLFEKIRQGEVWRLITPVVLHQDIFHIVFNMIWLVMLGRQMEKRLGALRYLVFMLIVGILSNTAQYLMSGSNFIGFSGILCGMLTFIYMRQKKAPWEGYDLQRSTFNLMLFFVLILFALQIASFFMEAVFGETFSPGIANTAHVSGGIVGWILGMLSYFRWKPQRETPAQPLGRR